ncbi:hypothetical protein Tco_1451773 [Tanacetum coccineum]
MERFENDIFKQREEINDRMAEMFGLLKELTTSRTPKKILMREEARHPITKNPIKSDEEEPPKGIHMKNEAERKADDEPAKSERENVTKNVEGEPAGASGSHV